MITGDERSFDGARPNETNPAEPPDRAANDPPGSAPPEPGWVGRPPPEGGQVGSAPPEGGQVGSAPPDSGQVGSPAPGSGQVGSPPPGSPQAGSEPVPAFAPPSGWASSES